MSSNVTRGEKIAADSTELTRADFRLCRICAKKLNESGKSIAVLKDMFRYTESPRWELFGFSRASAMHERGLAAAEGCTSPRGPPQIENCTGRGSLRFGTLTIHSDASESIPWPTLCGSPLWPSLIRLRRRSCEG